MSEHRYLPLTEQEAGLVLAALEQWDYESAEDDSSAAELHERFAAATEIVLREKLVVTP